MKVKDIVIGNRYVVQPSFIGTGLIGNEVIALAYDPDTCANNLHPNGTLRVQDDAAKREYFIGPEHLETV